MLEIFPIAFRDHILGGVGAAVGVGGFATIVLEAVADSNLWFLHAVFGFAGSCNNINILDVSTLHPHFSDGSTIWLETMNSTSHFIWWMVTALSLINSSKTILIPLTKKEKKFAGWQEAARKDTKRAFGVLQGKLAFVGKSN